MKKMVWRFPNLALLTDQTSAPYVWVGKCIQFDTIADTSEMLEVDQNLIAVKNKKFFRPRNTFSGNVHDARNNDATWASYQKRKSRVAHALRKRGFQLPT